MALQQSFEVSQNQLATIIYITDTTGTYDVSSNPGGYNTPNENRTDLALIMLATYKGSEADVDLTIDSYDPEDVTEWQVTDSPADGWHLFNVYSIAKKTGAETPVLNDFVYDFSGNHLQRWNGSSWVNVEYSELADNDVTHISVDYPVLSDLWSAFNLLNKLYIAGCKTMNRNDLKAAISDTSAMLNGTIALFAEGAFAQAQENIEKYQSRVDTILTLS